MKQLTVISGKGGTGKTSITAAFASLADNAVFADCDVDAADLHLIFKPEIKKLWDFMDLRLQILIRTYVLIAKNVLNHADLMQSIKT